MRTARLALLVVLFALPALAQSPRPPVTAENAPEILKRMTLTDGEFRGLIPGKEGYEAGYSLKNATGARGQTEGKPFFGGFWGVTGDGRRKPYKPDYEYRPGPTFGKGGKPWPFMRNPQGAEVTTVLRYAPVKQPPEGLRVYVTLRVVGHINYAGGDKLAENLARDEESAKEQIAKGHPFWYYTFVKDLGFGLDRNSMDCGFTKNGNTGQIDIWLARAKDFTAVHLTLRYDGHAISEKAATALARNAAAIVSNKVWGTAVKVERNPGEAGLVDAYTASGLGHTPAEDRRETKFTLGSPFYVALVYRTEVAGARCSFHVQFRPSGAAIDKSARIMPHVKMNTNRKPLIPGTYAAQTIQLTGAGGVSDVWSDTRSTPFVKALDDGLRVVYVKIPTEPDLVNALWKGPGQWEVEVNMHEYRGEGKDNVELATEKLKIDLVATPAYYTQNFTGLDPKTGEPKHGN